MSDICRRYHKGADTSDLAYLQTPQALRSKIRFQVFSKIKELGDATCDEVENLLGLSH